MSAKTPAAADEPGRASHGDLPAGWRHRYGAHGSIVTDQDGEVYWAIGEVLAFIDKRPMPGDTPDKFFYEVLPPPDVRLPCGPVHAVKYWKASTIRAWMEPKGGTDATRR